MRKLAKGPAIAAAILSTLTVLGLVINFVNSLSNPHTTVLNYVSQALGFIGTVLLIVVLFRGKADTFAAIGCFANIPTFLLSVINSVSSVITFSQLIHAYDFAASYLVSNAINALASLLKIAIFVLMALQCFRKDDRKNTLCVILPIVAAVLVIVQTIFSATASSGRTLASLFENAYLIGTIIGTVIGSLPLIFAGMAFGNIRTEDPAAVQAPLYQQYQQPPYQEYQRYQAAPQYQQPQYQAPQYQQPQYQAPQYQAPQYQPAQPQAPQYQAPQYQPAQPQAPQYQQPQYQQPQYQSPQEQ